MTDPAGKVNLDRGLSRVKALKKPLSFFFFLIVVVVLFWLIFFKPAITGHITITQEINYTDTIDLVADVNREYYWFLANPGDLKSIRLDGSITTNGTAKVYVEHNNRTYLIFDSTQLEGSLGGITGLAISNESIGNEPIANGSITNETNQLINEPIATESTINQSIINKTITLNLSYNPGTLFDADDDGVETTKGVIDLTVENTAFNWQVEQSKLCTKWEVYSEESKTSEFRCYGNENCCAFIDLQAKTPDWKEIFFSNYGKQGATLNNVIATQIIYYNVSLEPENLYAEIITSDLAHLDAKYHFEETIFTDQCIETCLLDGFNESFYKLIIEVNNSILTINNIEYSIAEKVNITENISINVKDKKGKKLGHYKLEKNEEGNYDLNLSSLPEKAKGKKSDVNIKNIRNLNQLKSLNAYIDATTDPEIRTDVIAVNESIDFDGAEVTLAKKGNVNAIVKCADFDFEAFSCSNWQRTGISFVDNGDTITFAVTGFSAYAGAEVALGEMGPVNVWNYTSNPSSGNDYARAVAVDTNNNILIAGLDSSSGDLVTGKIRVEKLNSSGGNVWNYTSNPSSNAAETAYAAAIGPNNSVIVAADDYSPGNYQIRVEKINSSGDNLWNYTSNPSSGADRPYGIAVDSNNNTVVVGYDSSTGEANTRLIVIKLDSSGSYLWNYTSNPSSSTDIAYAVAIDSNDNIIITGYDKSPGDAQLRVEKLNSSGDNMWNYTNNPSVGVEVSYAVAVDSNNNIIIAGSGPDIRVEKLNSSGDNVWNYTSNPSSGTDEAYAVSIDSADNTIIAGYDSSLARIRVEKINSSGANVWNYTSNSSSGNDAAYGVAVDSNNNIIIAGYDNSPGNQQLRVEKLSERDIRPPQISFQNPTPANNTITTNTTVQINISITEQNLSEFKWNWNGTNYTFYNDSLVLMFNFDNVSALGENDSYAVDVSSYGNNGTFKGNLEPAWDCANAKYGCALDFDGSDDFVNITDNDIFRGKSVLTFSAWFKIDPGTTQFKWLFEKTEGDASLSLECWNCLTPVFYVAGTNVGDIGTLSTGRWYHVALTLNGSVAKAYLNGTEIDSTDFSGSIPNNGDPIIIGRRITGTGAGVFNGLIDEIRVWNASLSANEIKQHYYSNLYKYDTDKWNFYSNQTNLTETTYIYQGFAKDGAGNLNSTELRILDLNTLPTVQLISPVNMTLTNQSSKTFICNITDNERIVNLTLYIWNSTGFINYTNTTSLSGTTNKTNWTYTLPYDNTFKWDCLGYDNSTSSVWSQEGNYTITLDTAAPGINFSLPTPANATAAANTSVEINISITNASDLGAFIWNWNGTNYSFYNDSLVLMLNFDNVSALGENNSYAVDVSSYRNNGTFKGNLEPRWNCTDARYGCALTFDGFDDYINITDNNIVRGKSVLTFSAWFKINPDVTKFKWLFEKGPGNGDFTFEHFNNLSAAFYVANTMAGEVGELSTGNWYHVALTLDGSTAKTYLNGTEINSKSFSTAVPDNDNPIIIGRRITGTGAGVFNGSIDEIRIWNRSFSADEIKQLYNSNLYKYNTDKWRFYSNQTNLTERAYSYQGCAKDTAGNENCTATRELYLTNNTPPTVANVILNSTDNLNRTNGTLQGFWAFSDSDAGDTQQNNETRWYNNSIEIPALENQTTVGHGNTTTGQNWIFSVRAYDGNNWSNWVNSTALTIRGETECNPPVIGEWNISSSDNVRCKNITITLNGNLTILGNLTFKNVTLQMNSSYNGEFVINNSGRFIVNSSNLTSVLTNGTGQYEFWNLPGSKLEIYYTNISYLGHNDITRANNMQRGLFVNTNDTVIKNNRIITSDAIADSNYNIYLYQASNNTIFNNFINSSRVSGANTYSHGILISTLSDNNNFTLNSIFVYSRNSKGILLQDSSNNYFERNNITVDNDGYSSGFYSDNGTNSTLINNTIISYYASADPEGAIYLYMSSGNTLRGNNISIFGGAANNGRGLLVDGTNKQHYNHSIDSSNILDGKSIYYFFDNNSQTIEDKADIALLYYTYSANITIKNNNLTIEGIKLINIENSSIYGNNITVTQHKKTSSIELVNSSFNSISNNSIDRATESNQIGIYLRSDSHDNIIKSNAITTGGYQCQYCDGIYLASSDNNNISDTTINTAYYDSEGIVLDNSNNALIINVTINTAYTGGTNAYGIHLLGSVNNTLTNSTISAINAADIYVNGAGNTVFINTTFNKSDTTFAAGATGIITVKWFLDAYVNDSVGNNISNVNVSSYNLSSDFIFSSLTDATGRITRQTLTEYMQNATSQYFQTNYSINTTLAETSNNTQSLNLTASTTLYIQLNYIPNIIDVNLTSNDNLNRTNGTLIGSFSYNDTDNGTTRLNETKWYNNSIEVTALANLTSVSSTNTSKGENWTFSVRVYDGEEWSSWANSTNLIIANTAPSNNFTTNITPQPAYTNDTLNCLNTSSVYDQDNDAVTLSYKWFNSSGEISGITANTLTPANFSKTDNITCEITATDTSSATASVNYSIVISNYWPTHARPILNSTYGGNYTNESLTCYNQSVNDVDNDAVTLYYGWYNNKTTISGITINMLGSGNFSKNDNLTCEITPYDGENNGTALNSTKLIILNYQPVFNNTITNITWNENFNLINNLTLINYFYDIDNDALTYNVTGNSSIRVIINQTTSNVTFRPATNWDGTEYIIFTATDGGYDTSSNNITLTVTSVARCGDGTCDSGESCSSCSTDCGSCAVEETKTTPPPPPPPPPPQPAPTPAIGPSVSVPSTTLSSLPCVNVTYTEVGGDLTLSGVNISDLVIPKDYEIILEPFNLDCNGESLDITLSIPENYVNVTLLKCAGDICLPQIVSEVTGLKCGMRIREIRRETKFLELEEMPINIKEKEQVVKRVKDALKTGNNSIQFVGKIFENITASISMPKVAVEEAVNPSLKIVGTPLVLRLSISPTPTSRQELSGGFGTVVTMPYVDENIFEKDSIAMYAKTEEGWDYLGGEINKENRTVTAEVKNITKYLDNESKATFALMGILCTYCVNSSLEWVYSPKEKSRDAIILVHGLASSPLTYQQIIDDIRLTNQPFNLLTFGYPGSKSIREAADEFSSLIEARSEEFDNIYIVAHSLGGLITQQALYMAYNQSYNYVPKVRKVILVGVPNEGSPIIEVYKDIFGELINREDAQFSLFNLNGRMLDDVAKGVITPRVPGVQYFVIAGTRNYALNLLFFKTSTKRLFATYNVSDGIVSLKSAQNIGGSYVDNKCDNYWELNVTHTNLIEDPTARKLVEKIIAEEVLKKELTLMGYNKYFDLKIDNCNKDTKYVVVGKRIDIEESYDQTGCKCGNGICGYGEDAINCPSDCAIYLEEKRISILPWVLVMLLVTAASYVYYVFGRYKRDVSKFNKLLGLANEYIKDGLLGKAAEYYSKSRLLYIKLIKSKRSVKEREHFYNNIKCIYDKELASLLSKFNELLDNLNRSIGKENTKQAVELYSELRLVYIKLVKTQPDEKIQGHVYAKLKRAYQSLKEILRVMRNEK